MKMSKPYSHANSYDLRVIDIPVTKSNLCFLVRESVAKDGKLVPSVRWSVDDPDHRYDGMSFNDFALENMLDAGLNLTAAFISLQNLECVDRLDGQLSSLHALVESQK